MGEFCHACGQQVHVHRTLSAFFHDLLHGVLHFEGKIWRTLPLLAWRPGDLTRPYIEGERARFVSPIALFLFAVFLMFAVISATGTIQPRVPTTREQTDLQFDVSKLNPAAKARKGSGAVLTVDDAPDWIREPLERASLHPDLLLYKLRSNSYKWSWLLIPLSVPFVWLLFPFSRRFRLYDHTVFVTYSLTSMTVLVTLASLFAYLNLGLLALLTILMAPIHLFRQVKGAYCLSRTAALWRTVILAIAALAVLVAFTFAMVALGLFD